ncbi:MAG: hypothetical protein HUU02_03290 [Bacteroidetes bacterium]|nr:hypothetical protein [Bacteroidota bacterium]
MYSPLSAQSSDGLQNAAWLIGTWKNTTAKGSIYETWDRTGVTEFSGKSYMLKERDTIVFESIRLVQEENGVFYIPVVKDQNNGAPVRFTAGIVTGQQMVFENPQHDFPQVISYTRLSADSLVAEISGMRNGKMRKQRFPMVRVR